MSLNEVAHAVEPEVDVRHLARIHGGSETLLSTQISVRIVSPGWTGNEKRSFRDLSRLGL
jgi:hypothetical protein